MQLAFKHAAMVNPFLVVAILELSLAGIPNSPEVCTINIHETFTYNSVVINYPSYIKFRYAVLKYKNVAYIKVVIGLDVFLMFTFTPYYKPSSPLW